MNASNLYYHMNKIKQVILIIFCLFFAQNVSADQLNDDYLFGPISTSNSLSTSTQTTYYTGLDNFGNVSLRFYNYASSTGEIVLQIISYDAPVTPSLFCNSGDAGAVNPYIGRQTTLGFQEMTFDCLHAFHYGESTTTPWTATSTATYHFRFFANLLPQNIWYYGDSVGSPYIEHSAYEPIDLTTRIINFTPADNSTTTNLVDFELEAYINSLDVEGIKGIRLSLHNIDQNVLLLGALSPADIWLLEDDIDQAGFYNFATTTTLADGNYRLEACIERNYLGGLFLNPWSEISECQSHQFIVTEGTFIGTISQNSFDELEDFYEGMSATTSDALASTCNLLNSNFDVRLCLAYLFIPSGEALHETIQSLKEGVLSRAPWGYLVRTYDIFSGVATSTLPTFTVTIPFSETASTTLFFDPADMIAGGALLLENTRDPIYNKNLRDVTEPLIRLFIAIFILFFIIKDVSGMVSSGGSRKDYDIKDS